MCACGMGGSHRRCVPVVREGTMGDIHALAEIPHFNRSFVDTRKHCGGRE